MGKFRHTESLNQLPLTSNTQTLFATSLVLALDPDFTTTILLPEASDYSSASNSSTLPLTNRYQPDLSDANHLLSSQQDHIDFSNELSKVLSPVSLQLKDNLSPPPIETLLDEPDHMISDLLNRITPVTDTMFIASSGQPASPIMPIDLSTFAPFDSHDLHSLELLNNLIIDEDILS